MNVKHRNPYDFHYHSRSRASRRALSQAESANLPCAMLPGTGDECQAAFMMIPIINPIVLEYLDVLILWDEI